MYVPLYSFFFFLKFSIITDDTASPHPIARDHCVNANDVTGTRSCHYTTSTRLSRPCAVAGVDAWCVVFALASTGIFESMVAPSAVSPGSQGPGPSQADRASSHSSPCGGQTGSCSPSFGSPCSVAPRSPSPSGGSASGVRAFYQAPSRSHVALALRQYLSAPALALSRQCLGHALVFSRAATS